MARKEGIKLSAIQKETSNSTTQEDNRVKNSQEANEKTENSTTTSTKSTASSNTEALKQLIKSGGFSLTNSYKKPLKKGMKRGPIGQSSDNNNMFGTSTSTKIPKTDNQNNEEEITAQNSLLGTPKTPPENSNNPNDKTYSDVPNNRIKVYLGPNYQESDVRKIFGQYGEIKKVICLSALKGSKNKPNPPQQTNTNKPDCSEVCIIQFANINSAIKAKDELHQTLHKEFVAKISVTFIKKEKKKDERADGKKNNNNSGMGKDQKFGGPGNRFRKNPVANMARPGFERRKDLQDDPEAQGRKMVSYDEDDLFD